VVLGDGVRVVIAVVLSVDVDRDSTVSDP